MQFERKYGVAATVTIPLFKTGTTTFAVTGDWTPAIGDVKISKNAGNVANIATLPVAVGGTGSKLWKFVFSVAELQAEEIVVQIVDAALEDDSISISTYGNAAAQHAFDRDNAINVSSGIVESNLKEIDSNSEKVGALSNSINTTDDTIDGSDDYTRSFRKIDSVYVDDGGASGTTHPKGLPNDPVANIADVNTITTANKIIKVKLSGSILADAAPTAGLKIQGLGPKASVINMNSKAITNVDFSDMDIQGLTTGTSNRYSRVVGGGTQPNFGDNSEIFDSHFPEDILPEPGCDFYKCTFGPTGQMILTNIGTSTMELFGVEGSLVVSGMTTAGTVNIFAVGGDLTLSGNTSGTINITGLKGKFTDDAAGATVNLIRDQDQDLILADTNEIQGKLPDNNIMGSGVTTNKDDEIDDIQNKINDGTNGLVAIKTQTVTNGTDINSIQNNTRFIAGIPSHLLIPDSGNSIFKLTCNLYDTDGNMEDPDTNEMAIKVENTGGTSKNDFFDDAGAATPATAAPSFSGHLKMVKISTGLYETFLKLPSTESVDDWTFTFQYKESTVTLVRTRGVLVVEENPGNVTLANNNTNKEVVARGVREFDADTTIGATPSTGSIEKGIRDKTNNLPSDPASETNVNANETKIDTLQSDLTVVKGKTDQLNFTSGNVHNHTKVQDNLALTAQQKLDVNTEVDGALNTAIPGSPVADSINERVKAIDDLTQVGGGGDLVVIKSKTDPLAFTAGNVHSHTKVQDDLALTAQQKLDVNTEVDTGLDEAIPELAQAKPSATPSIRTGLALLNHIARDKTTTTATEFSIFNDGGGTKLIKQTIADSAGTFTRSEAVSGA